MCLLNVYFDNVNQMTMRQDLLFKLVLLTGIILNMAIGCKKAETDPCEGMLNESPPAKIVLKFIDKQTGSLS